jgi:hypothetical protein
MFFLVLTTDRQFRVSANKTGSLLGQLVPRGRHFEELVTLVTARQSAGHGPALLGMLPVL